MTPGLKIVIASSGPAQFEFFREALTDAGHVPVAYLTSRTMRPSMPVDSEGLEYIEKVIAGIPAGMDLLLPGRPAAIADMLAGYEPDLMIVYGFNWRLPREVLDLLRLGVLNVHPSALPEYRGPSAIPWAIRNGDKFMGLTIHRMDEKIDTGPILAQVKDIPIPEVVSGQIVWELIGPALREMLPEAVNAVARGEPGIPQDESKASYAGFPPPEWREVTWKGGRNDLHNQIRVLRFLNRGQPPVVSFQGNSVRVLRTSLAADGGVRIECADGPLWVTHEPAAIG